MAAKSVLVVDDSEFVRNYHAYVFQQAGWEVITAVDGADGLEKLYGHGCSLILTDINMMGMDGYEFTRRVRADQRHDGIPIVIVSTESESSDLARGYEAGADLYLIKPSSPESMIESADMLLAKEPRQAQ